MAFENLDVVLKLPADASEDEPYILLDGETNRILFHPGIDGGRTFIDGYLDVDIDSNGKPRITLASPVGTDTAETPASLRLLGRTSTPGSRTQAIYEAELHSFLGDVDLGSGDTDLRGDEVRFGSGGVAQIDDFGTGTDVRFRGSVNFTGNAPRRNTTFNLLWGVRGSVTATLAAAATSYVSPVQNYGPGVDFGSAPHISLSRTNAPASIAGWHFHPFNITGTTFQVVGYGPSSTFANILLTYVAMMET